MRRDPHYQRDGHCLLAALLAVFSFGSIRAADFQLHEYSFEEDSLTYKGTYFQKDAQTRIAIRPPEGWNNVGDATALTMIPPTPVGSVVRLETSPFSPRSVFKDKGLEVYRQKALESIASGATAVRILEEHDNAFSFFEWHAYEFVVAYDFYGQAFERSLLFVNVSPTEQITLSAVAPKDGFKQVHDAATGVLRSWHALPTQ